MLLICHYCRRTINEHYATVIGGWVHCPECFAKLFSVCSICKKAISNSYMIVENDENDVPVRMCYQCHAANTYWRVNNFWPDHQTYTIIGSRRKFGVEIETAYCPSYRTLKGRYAFSAKSDASIRGVEFASSILWGDGGLEEITNFCRAARKLKWRTDRHCGLHIHCDMQNESDNAVRSVAYAYLLTEPMWRSFVNSYRANQCTYCSSLDFTSDDIENASDWFNFCSYRNRYSGINLNAYARYGTYEIRLHQGSLDSRAITSWIRVHLRFIDAMARMASKQDVIEALGTTTNEHWEAFKRIVKDPYLIKYYGRRRATRLALSSVA